LELLDRYKNVDQLEYLFYEKLFGHLANAHELAKEEPAFLVKILRLIENDIKVNEALEEKYKEVRQKFNCSIAHPSLRFSQPCQYDPKA